MMEETIGMALIKRKRKNKLSEGSEYYYTICDEVR
jgi:hypothetical protein